VGQFSTEEMNAMQADAPNPEPESPASHSKNEPVAVNPGDSMTNNEFKAIVVGVLTIIVCGFAMVPGWAPFGLEAGLERPVFYSIAAIVGSVCGFIVGSPRLLGMISGAILMAGSLLSLGLLLDNFERVYKVMVVLAIMIGAAPGFILYHVGAWIHRKLFGTLEPAPNNEIAGDGQPSSPPVA
jgi:hypothetical protein